MKKMVLYYSLLVFIMSGVLTGCSFIDSIMGKSSSNTNTNNLLDLSEINKGLSNIVTFYSNAMADLNKKNPVNYSNNINNFKLALKALDSVYKSKLESNFTAYVSKITEYPLNTALPLNVDHAIYLQGGYSDFGSAIFSWLSPSVSSGKYFHSAIFDLSLWQSGNSNCFITATADGVGYQSVEDWQRFANVTVMVPKQTVNFSNYNTIKKYLTSDLKDERYSIFTIEDYKLLPVKKSDETNWYCNKVPWRFYNDAGVDLDNNTNIVDFKTSGIYQVMEAYINYKFSNANTRTSELNSYLSNMRYNLILAEEFYYNDKLTNVYEIIRDTK